jgi:hypothetical protein
MFDTITGVDENDQNCIDFGNMKDYIYRDSNKSRVLDTTALDMRKQTDLHNLKGITVGVVEEF